MRLNETLDRYVNSKTANFHTPGHKGNLTLPSFKYDVTELPQTSCLFDTEGPIVESEMYMSSIYGSTMSYFSAGGATLCIQTMLSFYRGKTVLVSRNSHLSVHNAMAHLDITPIWLYPDVFEDEGLLGCYSKKAVQTILKTHPEISAVFITSPDYMGMLSDIAGIASVSHEYGADLLVDNSHGSHLKFCGEKLHPIDLGADWCCDSFHKTLPVMTGGAVLHTKTNRQIWEVKQAMSLFASTSPNFMILSSLDSCADYLANSGKKDFENLTNIVSSLNKIATKNGFILPRGEKDPVRFTIGTGQDLRVLSSHFKMLKIAPEAIINGFAIFLPSVMSSPRDIQMLKTAVQSWVYPQSFPTGFEFAQPEQVMTGKEALSSPTARILVEDSLDRISAQAITTCPPGIPVITPGEKICEKTIKMLKSNGILNIIVVK